jgi:hypothetical protein
MVASTANAKTTDSSNDEPPNTSVPDEARRHINTLKRKKCAQREDETYDSEEPVGEDVSRGVGCGPKDVVPRVSLI